MFAVAARIGVAMVLVCCPSLDVLRAEGSQQPPTDFGGPDSVPKTIEEDESDKRPVFETGFLDAYHEFKKRLTEKTGFSYGVDYSAVYLWQRSPETARTTLELLMSQVDRYSGTQVGDRYLFCCWIEEPDELLTKLHVV